MAMPVLKGKQTENEKFAGAVDTWCIEALMQDGKALQVGTSHFLGQNFARAFDVKFATQEGGTDYVWGTSWGVSTRLMGALIMAHGDDHGLVLPPLLAPFQVVVIPIYKSAEELAAIGEKASEIIKSLKDKGISVKYDDRDTHKPGWKFAEYELKGVPVRIAIGPRDLKNNTAEVARRDTMEKENYKADNLAEKIDKLLLEIQQNIYDKALAFREKETTSVDSYKEFKEVIQNKGGFILAHWDGTTETEQKIQEETKATIRCILMNGKDMKENGKCVYSGKPSERRVVFAKAY